MPLGFDPKEHPRNRAKSLSLRDEDGQMLAALDKIARTHEKPSMRMQRQIRQLRP